MMLQHALVVVLLLAIIRAGPVGAADAAGGGDDSDLGRRSLPVGPRADAVVHTSAPLVVFYRLSERAANSFVSKARPAWVGDAPCLRSALVAFAGERPLVVLVDGPLAPATRRVLDAAVAAGAAEAVDVAGGSASASFGAALNLSLRLPPGTLVYFAEDDYVYEGGGAGGALREGAALGDYVSLYESPVAYEDWRDRSVWRHDLANILISRDAAAAAAVVPPPLPPPPPPSSERLLQQQQQQQQQQPPPQQRPSRQPLGTLHTSASARWRSVVALTMTFASRVDTLAADADLIRAALRWDMPRDFYMSSKLRAAGRVLLAAAPSAAAHGETNFVGAGRTDWAARVAATGARCPAAAAAAPPLSDGALSALREARALEFEVLRCGVLAPGSGSSGGDNVDGDGSVGEGPDARGCGVGADARALHHRAAAASARAAAFVAALSAVRAGCCAPPPPEPPPPLPPPPAALFDCVDMRIRLLRVGGPAAGAGAGEGAGASTPVAWEPPRAGLGAQRRTLSSEPVRLDWGNDPSWAATLVHAHATTGPGRPGGGDNGTITELSALAASLAEAAGHYAVPRVLGYCAGGGVPEEERGTPDDPWATATPPALLLHAFPFARPVEVVLCDDADRAAPPRAAARLALVAMSLCGHLARARLALRAAPVDAFVVDGASGVLGLSADGAARLERATTSGGTSARGGAAAAPAAAAADAADAAAPTDAADYYANIEDERAAAAAMTARALGCGLLRAVAAGVSSEPLARVAEGLCDGTLTCATGADAVRAAVRGDVALPGVEACLVQGVCQ